MPLKVGGQIRFVQHETKVTLPGAGTVPVGQFRLVWFGSFLRVRGSTSTEKPHSRLPNGRSFVRCLSRFAITHTTFKQTHTRHTNPTVATSSLTQLRHLSDPICPNDSTAGWLGRGKVKIPRSSLDSPAHCQYRRPVVPFRSKSVGLGQ